MAIITSPPLPSTPLPCPSPLPPGVGHCPGSCQGSDPGPSPWGLHRSCPPSGLTCKLNGHPHLVGTHAARLVQVKLPEDGLGWGAEGEGSVSTQPFPAAQRGGLPRVGGEGVSCWDMWAQKGRRQGEGLGTTQPVWEPDARRPL